MKTKELTVLSLRPDPADPLGLDLKHVLAALGGKLQDWAWCVKSLDWLGANGEPLCQAVEEAGPGGLWLDSEALVNEADGIYQTVEGEFLAFPKAIDRGTLGPLDLGITSFPASPAVVAIVAIDGCYFDIYSKDPEATSLIHERFPLATVEDPEAYF